MSLITETSPKHCANKGVKYQLKKLLSKKFIYGFSSSISSLLFIILLLYLFLHPSKPEFYLKDTTLDDLSLSPSPNLLNSTIQITLLSQNPNSRVGVYYENIRAYAIYKGQQITGDSDIPPFYQGQQDSNVISMSLYGTGMPVAPSIGYEVSRDQIKGKMMFSLRLDGKLRYKIGSWVSGSNRFEVDCVAIVALRMPQSLGQGTQCSTNV